MCNPRKRWMALANDTLIKLFHFKHFLQFSRSYFELRETRVQIYDSGVEFLTLCNKSSALIGMSIVHENTYRTVTRRARNSWSASSAQWKQCLPFLAEPWRAKNCYEMLSMHLVDRFEHWKVYFSVYIFNLNSKNCQWYLELFSMTLSQNVKNRFPLKIIHYKLYSPTKNFPMVKVPHSCLSVALGGQATANIKHVGKILSVLYSTMQVLCPWQPSNSLYYWCLIPFSRWQLEGRERGLLSNQSYFNVACARFDVASLYMNCLLVSVIKNGKTITKSCAWCTITKNKEQPFSCVTLNLRCYCWCIVECGTAGKQAGCKIDG